MCACGETEQVAGPSPLMRGEELSSLCPVTVRCLRHWKENVELTFHLCQIMLAEYSYFSHCKLPCGDAAFKCSFVSSYFRTPKMGSVQKYIPHSSAVLDGTMRAGILQKKKKIAVDFNGCYIALEINRACSFLSCGRENVAKTLLNCCVYKQITVFISLHLTTLALSTLKQAVQIFNIQGEAVVPDISSLWMLTRVKKYVIVGLSICSSFFFFEEQLYISVVYLTYLSNDRENKIPVNGNRVFSVL